MLDQHRRIVRACEQMTERQRAIADGGSRDDEIRVVTDPAEVSALSVDLCRAAEKDVATLDTAHYRNNAPDVRSAKHPPADLLARGVRFRTVYARSTLELPGAGEMVRRCAEGGWELRVLPDLPATMVLVDSRAALLPLDPAGMSGAVLVRAPDIVATLRTYFELQWDRAQPLHDTGGPGTFTPSQRTVLRLMIGGLTDAAIARHLDVSERTVRRHISAALEALGVDNRITATAVCVREGRLD